MDSEFFKKYFNLFYLTQILRTLKSELQTFVVKMLNIKAQISIQIQSLNL